MAGLAMDPLTVDGQTWTIRRCQAGYVITSSSDDFRHTVQDQGLVATLDDAKARVEDLIGSRLRWSHSTWLTCGSQSSEGEHPPVLTCHRIKRLRAQLDHAMFCALVARLASSGGRDVRWWTNQSRARSAAASSVPGSSNRWVAPGTTAQGCSQRICAGPGG